MGALYCRGLAAIARIRVPVPPVTQAGIVGIPMPVPPVAPADGGRRPRGRRLASTMPRAADPPESVRQPRTAASTLAASAAIAGAISRTVAGSPDIMASSSCWVANSLTNPIISSAPTGGVVVTT